MNASAFDPETQLALAAQAGDREALESLCERLRPRLLRSAVYVLGPGDPEAEDSAQDALLLLSQRLAQFDPAKAGVYTWASHITVRVALKRLNRRRRLLLGAEADFETLLAPQAQARHAAAETATQQAEWTERLRRRVQALAEPCRGLLQARLRGLSTIEIGRQQRLAIGTVLSRLHRCRQALIQAWRAEEVGLEA